VYHELAAKYLPTIAETFRATECAVNASMTLLNVISYTPYFIRFSKQPEGANLVAVHSRRLAAKDPFPNGVDASTVGEVCQFLATLIVLQGTESIAPEDRTALAQRLREWKREYTRTFAAETSGRCLTLLNTSSADNVMITRTIKAKLDKGVENCNSPECNVTVRNNGAELLQCSRCKSVRYCGVEHQRKDWPEHKQICCPASF